MFSCEFWRILKNIFFTEHLWTTASKQVTVPLQCLQTTKSLINSFRRTGETILSNYWQNAKIVSYNLVFLFNVSRGFFLCNVGEVCVQSWREQQPVENKSRRKVMLFRRKCTDLFPVQFAWNLLGNTQGFWLCNVASRVLSQNSTRFFSAMLPGARQHRQDLRNILPLHFSSRVLRQQWTGFFSRAMLPEASWTTLHKVFTCAMLFQDY